MSIFCFNELGDRGSGDSRNRNSLKSIQGPAMRPMDADFPQLF